MQYKIKFLDESNISFKIENSMLEVYDQYDELIGSQPLPIPYDENMSGDEIYQKAEECGYDIDDMISDIVKKAIEDTKQYDFWLSDDVVIFYSPSKQCCTSEPYEGVFAKLKEIYMEDKKNFELGIDNVKTENLDCPIEDNEESLITEDEIEETIPEVKPTVVEEEEKIVVEEVVEEKEPETPAPVLEKKEVPMPKPKNNQPQPKPQNNQQKPEEKKPQQNNQPQPKPQNNQQKPEEKKPQQNNQPQPKPQNNQQKPEEKKPQQNNQPQPKPQNNQSKPEEKKPQQNNQPQPKPQNNQQKPEEKKPQQNNQPQPKPQTAPVENREITFCVPTDSKKMSDFKAAISAIANYNAKNSDGKIGEVANMVVQLIEQKNINPSDADEKDLVYDLALNNVTIIEGLSPVRAGIYKAMLLKELKNLGF